MSDQSQLFHIFNNCPDLVEGSALLFLGTVIDRARFGSSLSDQASPAALTPPLYFS